MPEESPNPKGVATERKENMPQSLSVVYIHLVFSTKERRPFLRDQRIREKAHAYLGEVSKRLEFSRGVTGLVAQTPDRMG